MDENAVHNNEPLDHDCWVVAGLLDTKQKSAGECERVQKKARRGTQSKAC